MIIERSTKQSILPEAIDALITNQTATLYHSDYSLRPPLGVYNTSLQKIWKAFELVLSELEKLMTEQPFRGTKDKEFSGTFDEHLTDAQEQLIHAIKEHFDDCENVLRCFFPVTVGKGQKLWVEPCYAAYFQAIKPFFDHISEIANHVKHHQGRLRLFVMFNDQYCIPGYFVEAINSKGEIVPNPKIHIPVKAKLDPTRSYDTAFSFFRDLRYLIWGVYFISYHLSIAINQATNSNAPVQYAPRESVDEKILKLSQQISNLPFYFFKDELEKEVPTVTLLTSEDETRLRFACPDPFKFLIGYDGNYKLLLTWVGDGVTKSFRLLYQWGEDQ